MHIPFVVFGGVLPYPVTFLCTDFISELYGKKRANTVVWVGLILNIWVIFILWLGGALPPQFVDVHLFHALKRVSRGKMLWLRNNGSTLTSQMVDSLAVITVTYFTARSAIHITPGVTIVHSLVILILSNYVFKMVAALLDTIPFYLGVGFLTKYLEVDTLAGYREEDFKLSRVRAE